MKNNVRFLLYAVVVFMAGCVMLVSEHMVVKSFKKSSEVIVDQYDNYINNYRKHLGLDRNEISSLAMLLRADSTQYTTLRRFLEKPIDESSYVIEDGVHLLEQSQKVLELQMGEVRSQYEALEVWVAIITIVFLIFSFYSFHRMDEMIRDGKEKITSLDIIGKQKIQQISSSAATSIAEMEANQTSLLNQIESMAMRKSLEMNSSFEKLKSDLLFKSQEINKQLNVFNTGIEAYKTEYYKRIIDIEHVIKDVQNTVSELEKESSGEKETLKNLDKLLIDYEELKKDLAANDERLSIVEGAKNPTQSKIIKDLLKRVQALEAKK